MIQNGRKLKLDACVRGLVICLLAFAFVSSSRAQVDIPFQVLFSEGTLDRLPDPMNPEQNHVINSGMALLDGNMLSYSGNGRVRLLGPPDPMTGIAPFESALPFLFDFGNGDTLQIHYGRTDFGAPEPGMVQLTPLPSGLVDTEWLAVFNPVPGSGTGQFADVIGGAFLMTAETDPFDPTSTNIPYSWSSDVGFLTFVPEPSSLIVLGGAALVIARFRRRHCGRRRHSNSRMGRLVLVVAGTLIFQVSLGSAVLAAPIQAGTTLFPSARAIQDVTVFANTSINPTGQEFFFDDLFGISTAGIVRDAQDGDSIDFTLTGWAFEGSNVLGDYRFGAVGPFTGADYTGVISNVVQDPTDPGFATGDPSSFVSGDVFLTGSSFAFEFLSGPLTGTILVTDPAQIFEFESTFDGLPPSLGTAFTPTAGSNDVLDVYLTDVSGNLVELVGTSSDRRVITIPEPGSLTLLSLVGLVGLWRVRKR